MVYDVAIIGGGVVGCSVLNKLVRCGKNAILLEKNDDVANGTTKANSGIIHAGFDAKPGTLKAKLNVRGAVLYPKLCEELSIPLINNGAVVIGSDKASVETLYKRGIENGVNNLQILNRDQLIKLLPNISDDVNIGLYAKTSAIVSPYMFTIALAEESVINGGKILFNFKLDSFYKEDDYYVICCKSQKIYAKKIVVAVGSKHNEVAEILKTNKYNINFRRGEYFLLDKGSMSTNGLTVFPLPNKNSKGILISPTTSGNIIVGPTSISCEDDETITTKEALDLIINNSSTTLKNINFNKNIRVFSGVRTLIGDDFVIEKDCFNSDVINVTGICSPGLTSAPAIAEEVLNLLNIPLNEYQMKRRKPYVNTNNLNTQQLNELIKTNFKYGKIVCRCENVSEGEIIDAINSPLNPVSIDAIKRRTRAGMGRCQGGFCMTKIMEIISKEKNIPFDEICKENKNSKIIIGDID